MNTSLRLSALYLTWLRTQRHLRSCTTGGPRRGRTVAATRRAAEAVPALRLTA